MKTLLWFVVGLMIFAVAFGVAIFLFDIPLGELIAPSTPTVPTQTATSTRTPTPTATLDPTMEPTATPTGVPTPTTTPEPTIWGIARRMVLDTLPVCDFDQWPAQPEGTAPQELSVKYDKSLEEAVLAAHPELGGWYIYTNGFVFTEKSGYQNPFAFADLNPNIWMRVLDSVGDETPEVLLQDPQAPVLFMCESYIVALEANHENNNGNGILSGEVYLFYEVGGKQALFLDGELRKVHFKFE